MALLCLAIAALYATSAPAQDAQLAGESQEARVVTVGVYASPPFVIASQRDNTFSGMAIDLWEAAAVDLKLAYRYVGYSNLRQLVDATRNGSVDVAVTNLTITRERAETIQFSQPWYDAGLRIMVPDNDAGGFRGIWNGLMNAGHVKGYALLLGIIFVATLLLTLFDRKFDPEFPPKWHEGLAESLYHVVLIASGGKSVRRNLFGWRGRIWSSIWLICGVATVAYVTSTVTSVMTTISLTQSINSLSDLPGKTVGVFSGSVAERFSDDLGLASIPYEGLDDAVAALKRDEIDAIIADAPILEHFAFSHPQEKLTVVGNIFHPDKYGFGFPLDSDLAKPVTLKLLELQERGVVEAIRLDYFGNKH